MITSDRYGKTLPTSQPVFDPFYSWEVRMAATNGSYTSTSGWTYYQIPENAIVSRSRSAALDGETWQCELEVLAGQLPSGTTPLAYYQLEIDLIDTTGNRWPYFTGPIQQISDSYVKQGGAIVETHRIVALGVLRRGKGLRINRISVTPARTSYTALMTGLAQVATISVSKTASTTVVSDGKNTVDATVGTGSFPGIKISANADFSSPLTYGAGASEYTITTTAGAGFTINWGGSVANGTYYVKYWALQRFIVGRLSDPFWSSPGTNPAFIRIPDGNVAYSGADSIPKRRWFDTFQTYSTSASTTTAITVRDPDPYKSGNALVAVSGGPTEYLIWTKTDGNEEARQISSVDASGVITVSSAFSAAPASGDPIRLGTCEGVRTWELWNRAGGDTADQARFYSDAGRTTEYARNRFVIEPRSGSLQPAYSQHYASASDIVGAGTGANALYVALDTISTIGSDNRIESLYSQILVTSLSLIPAADLSTNGTSGGFFKSFTRWDTDLDAVLADIDQNGLPPNGYLHDTPGGKIRVDGFKQSSAPDLEVPRIGGVNVASLPEPITSVAVVSKGPERNIGPLLKAEWTDSEWTSPGRMFDGLKGSNAPNATSTTSGAIVRVDVTPPSSQAFPHITGLRLHGTIGAISVKAEQYSRTTRAIISSRMVEGFGYMVLSSNGDNFIPGDRLNEALGALNAAALDDSYLKLAITFYPDDGSGSTTTTLTEIEVLSDVEAVWTAFLTDDTSGSPPTDWSTENGAGYGSIWWQRDLKLPKSYRFMSAATAKRILPVWASGYGSQRHRMERLTVEQITQDECRDYAERYLDEYVRGSREYQVRAILDPRIDLGDTVAITLPDGTSKTLFVWAISDGGARNDLVAQYDLVDYAA